MTFEIRQAVIDDLRELNELNKEIQSLHHKIDPEYFRPADRSDIRGELQALIEDEKSGVLVADSKGLLLGFLSYRECSLPKSGLTNEIPMLFIHHMGVKRIFYKQGIGTALMDAVCKIAGEKGIKRVQLDVWSRNSGAKEFFLKSGFKTVNEIMVHKL